MQQDTSTMQEGEMAPPRLVEFLDRLARPRGPVAALFSLLLMLLLVLAVLLAPPVSLAARLAESGYQHIGKEGGRIVLTDGTELGVPGDGLSAPVPVRMTILPLASTYYQVE